MEMERKKKSEGILKPYNEKLKKSYLHGGGYIEIDGVEYSPDEYITMLEEANKSLTKQIEQFKKGVKAGTNIIEKLEEENRKLIESEKYRHSRCMKAERQIQHSLGGDDELIEEGLYD